MYFMVLFPITSINQYYQGLVSDSLVCYVTYQVPVLPECYMQLSLGSLIFIQRAKGAMSESEIGTEMTPNE